MCKHFSKDDLEEFKDYIESLNTPDYDTDWWSGYDIDSLDN